MNSTLTSDILSQIQFNMPKLNTREALVILNVQNDSFDMRNHGYLCRNQEIRRYLAAVVPYFRQKGDVVWVKTELDMIAAAQRSSGEERRGPAAQIGQSPPLPPSRSSSSGSEASGQTGSQSHSPTSQNRMSMDSRTFQARVDARQIELESLDLSDDPEAYLKKPRKGASSRPLFMPGSKGADLTQDMLVVIDKNRDLVVTKNNYSAFDGTPLLMSLRMKLVTHIYLAGCLSNISIYSTAADAVSHGFNVTLVEDCLGYRNESKHLEALQKMRNLLSVQGTDSQAIIEEVRQTLKQTPDYSPRQEHHGSTNILQDTEMERTKKSKLPSLRPGDRIGEGDSRIIYDALSSDLAVTAFKDVFQEVDWQAMRHRSGEVPRRVAVQGESSSQGVVPLYRHPADESPPFMNYTPTVRKIRDQLQVLLNQPFNHCLIQLYRDGYDNISEHSDKTLDIVRGSNIVNLSLGAQRRMTLRTKHDVAAKREPNTRIDRNAQQIPMPHNSVFVLGWQTNAKWLHGVRADKRASSQKTKEECAYGGQRISLTFRYIGTYTNHDRTKIWGQGAKSKTEANAGKIITTKTPELEAMICAFGNENHQADFDWDRQYGKGFDVLNLIITNPPSKMTLTLSKNEISNMRVKLAVLHNSLPYEIQRDESTNRDKANGMSVKSLLAQEDEIVLQGLHGDRNKFVGVLEILAFIEEKYPTQGWENNTVPNRHPILNDLARRTDIADELLRCISNSTPNSETAIAQWEDIAGRTSYISGNAFTIDDCLIWPVVNELVRRWKRWDEKKYPHLASYWKRVGALPVTRQAMMERGGSPGRVSLSRTPS